MSSVCLYLDKCMVHQLTGCLPLMWVIIKTQFKEILPFFTQELWDRWLGTFSHSVHDNKVVVTVRPGWLKTNKQTNKQTEKKNLSKQSLLPVLDRQSHVSVPCQTKGIFGGQTLRFCKKLTLLPLKKSIYLVMNMNGVER